MAGPNQPVIHNELHDMESFFYVLVGIAVLFDEPGKPKPDSELEKCFDILFNTNEPSYFKTATVQSDATWIPSVVKHISPYFQPIIPLLNNLRQDIICPLKSDNNCKFTHTVPFTHDTVIKHLVSALCELPDDCWTPRPTLDSHNDPTIPAEPEEEEDGVSDDEMDTDDDEDEVTSSPPPPPPVLLRDVGVRRAARADPQSNPELHRKRAPSTHPPDDSDVPIAKRLRSSNLHPPLPRPDATVARGHTTNGATTTHRRT